MTAESYRVQELIKIKEEQLKNVKSPENKSYLRGYIEALKYVHENIVNKEL